MSRRSVNVEDFITVGEKILVKMTDSPVKEYVFKKADKAIQMPCLSVIKIGNGDGLGISHHERCEKKYLEQYFHITSASN